ncbi:putative enoyl dehydratase (DH), mitochondrial [Rhizophagus clarus]|uniref:Acyl-CoA dehydrogenase n=1 Tax=Rhizophagus clarus TaxID=94130 RepID=A0A2Z6QWI6_9GLOM|nr:putative enoyl dehydratase (DH), mitochondrial [Rhizophagus clarus]GES86084.1 acyl-CoA dehydrogenase [Rhizophagus clarus]
MNLYAVRSRTSQCLAGSRQIRTFFNTLERKGSNANTDTSDTKKLINEWKKKVTRDTESFTDTITASPLQLFAITLRRNYITDDIPATQIPPEGTRVPPNYHLAYFSPRIYEKDLGSDGSEIRHEPPLKSLRRMWAGGELSFSANNPLCVGQHATMSTKCREVEVKSSPRGENIFIWIDRNITNEFGWSMRDTRCLVYMKLEEKKPEQKIVKLNKTPDFEQIVFPTPLLLFRFSALTFNSHRIHYDHPYTTQVERYPGCLVHGPLTLTLLLDLMRDNLPNKISYIKSFSYRAVSPLFVGEEFKICGRRSESDLSGSSYELWAENKHGGVAMKGNAIIENI